MTSRGRHLFGFRGKTAPISERITCNVCFEEFLRNAADSRGDGWMDGLRRNKERSKMKMPSWHEGTRSEKKEKLICKSSKVPKSFRALVLNDRNVVFCFD